MAHDVQKLSKPPCQLGPEFVMAVSSKAATDLHRRILVSCSSLGVVIYIPRGGTMGSMFGSVFVQFILLFVHILPRNQDL